MITNAVYPSEVLFQKESSWLRDFLLVLMGSILLSLCAPLSIPLPFTPVPITVASHLCLILGAVLGKNRGALAVVAYLIQGAIGLPVFAGGAAGLARFFGPTGGYLLGSVVAAYATGYLIEKAREKSGAKIFLSLTVGNGILYLFGIPHLSLFVGFKSALLLGLVPFILGDTLKLFAAYKAVRTFLRVEQR